MNLQRAWLACAFLLVLVTAAISPSGGQAVLSDHPSGACSSPFHVQGAGWDLCWQQDEMRAQGIELNQVYFHDELAIWKIGFPFSITRYENDVHGPFKDTLGQSVFGGENPGFGRGSMQIHPLDCPRFLGTGVLLNDRHICLESREGPEQAIAIWASYDIFNYRFLQGYILDSRGSVEPFVRLGGLLIDGDEVTAGSSSVNHFHHLYWRVDFDIGEDGDDEFQMFMRPHEDWNDWDPYMVWTASEDEEEEDGGSDQGPHCSRVERIPANVSVACHGDGQWVLVDPLEGLPAQCRDQVASGSTGWCSIHNESALLHHPALFTKWRVHDPLLTNRWDNGKSFESTGRTHVDSPGDGVFTTFDALALQYAGDSDEVGFNVPLRPLQGDVYLRSYLDPPEPVTDAVAWLAVNAYHDTRDEESPTMSYHHISFQIQPRNFMDGNPGEDTYNQRPFVSVPPLPGGIEPNPPGGIEI